MLVFDTGGDYGARIDIVDRISKQTRTLVSDPWRSLVSPAVSKDGRVLYFTSRGAESDIWLITLSSGSQRSTRAGNPSSHAVKLRAGFLDAH